MNDSNADKNTINISIKMLGKRRPVMENLPLTLPSQFYKEPTLKTFLHLVVAQQVSTFQEKQQSKNWIAYLNPQELKERAEHGKVTFGTTYNEEQADLEKAKATALQAFEDGIFLVVVDGVKKEHLNEEISFKEDSEVVFIRLVALAGGYF